MQKILKFVYKIKLAAILFCICGSVFAQQKDVKQAWPTPSGLGIETHKLSALIDPTLQPPALTREPEYTWGLSNTLYWNCDSVAGFLAPLNLTLLYFEIQATYTAGGKEVLLWGIVNADVDSAAFKDLPESIHIDYVLRYFASGISNDFMMSFWSEPVWSIQDLKPPVIHEQFSGIIGVESLGSQRWIVDNTCLIRIVASDSIFGKIMQIAVRESSSVSDEILYRTVIPPKLFIDTTLQHIIDTPEKTQLRISWWFTDVAVQSSQFQSDDISWWPEEDGMGEILCFPIPYNPFNADESSQCLNHYL